MTWEQPDEILKKGHRQFARDIEYPESGSEERYVMVDHYNNGVGVWESKALEGIYWAELFVSDQNLVLGGTGTDALPANFLTFFRRTPEEPAYLKIGSVYYREVSASEGARFIQEGDAASIFWEEGSNLRTYPAVASTIPFPYLKKATRITTGDETTPLPEMKNKTFLSDFITARLALDNEDDTLYQQYNNDAIDKLNTMVGNHLASQPSS